MSDPYRMPGRVDPPQGWAKCATCPAFLSPWHNARRTPAGIVCIPCWERAGRP